MNRFIHIVFAFFIGTRAFASAPDAMLDSASNAYAKKDFQKAAGYYEKILAAGYEAPEVYYNLGNACFKLDQIGPAILNYERAKKLAPRDPDIAFNLKMANQRTVDKIEPAPAMFLDDWWDALKSAHSEKTWAIRSLVCFTLIIFFLGVFLVSAKLINKQFGFWLGLAFCILSAVSFAVAKSRYNDLASHHSAVILSSSAEVKNAPAENGTRLFLLHEGAKVATPETNGDWVRVELSPEKVGWVKRSQIEFI